jgi:hypothetical protein
LIFSINIAWQKERKKKLIHLWIVLHIKLVLSAFLVLEVYFRLCCKHFCKIYWENSTLKKCPFHFIDVVGVLLLLVRNLHHLFQHPSCYPHLYWDNSKIEKCSNLSFRWITLLRKKNKNKKLDHFDVFSMVIRNPLKELTFPIQGYNSKDPCQLFKINYLARVLCHISSKK